MISSSNLTVCWWNQTHFINIKLTTISSSRSYWTEQRSQQTHGHRLWFISVVLFFFVFRGDGIIVASICFFCMYCSALSIILLFFFLSVTVALHWARLPVDLHTTHIQGGQFFCVSLSDTYAPVSRCNASCSRCRICALIMQAVSHPRVHLDSRESFSRCSEHH